MKNKHYIILFLLLQSQLFAWNATGHRLIAQIAYDQMTPQAKQIFNHYNQALDKVYQPQTIVESATWLDTLAYKDIHWFASMHYVDLPFTTDNTPLLPPQKINALWAIRKAKKLLCNKYPTDFDKGIALRILIHIVGDLHQPLHAVTKISTQFPQGDHGGNYVSLPKNPIAKNLHSYWDKGGGFLVTKHRYNQVQIKRWAATIEHHWPCTPEANDGNIDQWVQESHRLAINKVYKIIPTDNLEKDYQNNTRKIAEERIALAGCRLGALLNKMARPLGCFAKARKDTY